MPTGRRSSTGRATVTAITTNLWQARQTLLRYGSACTVLDPAELVELFRAAIAEMAANYGVALPTEEYLPPRSDL